MLVRRSGLPKQTVSAIVNGRSPQPTGGQIVALARAFRVEPDDVLAGIGLWEREDRELPPLATYLREALRLGDEQARYVERSVEAMRAERRLAELEAEYAAMQGDDEEGEELTEDERVKRQGERLGIDRLHPVAAESENIQPLVDESDGPQRHPEEESQDREENDERG